MKELAVQMGHGNPFTLAYQSRVGPVEWLKPYTEEALEELGQAKTNDLVVVPISFVSEHIETLGNRHRIPGVGHRAGVVNFRRVRALDTYAPFIGDWWISWPPACRALRWVSMRRRSCPTR